MSEVHNSLKKHFTDPKKFVNKKRETCKVPFPENEKENEQYCTAMSHMSQEQREGLKAAREAHQRNCLVCMHGGDSILVMHSRQMESSDSHYNVIVAPPQCWNCCLCP